MTMYKLSIMEFIARDKKEGTTNLVIKWWRKDFTVKSTVVNYTALGFIACGVERGRSCGPSNKINYFVLGYMFFQSSTAISFHLSLERWFHWFHRYFRILIWVPCENHNEWIWIKNFWSCLNLPIKQQMTKKHLKIIMTTNFCEFKHCKLTKI